MRHIEENMQMNCVRWFELQYGSLARKLHHSPNGGRRDAREGARFKRMGTRAGFPDLGLYIARHGYHGLFIEMKADKGVQTPSQKQWQRMLESEGYAYRICRDFYEFKDIVEWYLSYRDGFQNEM